LESKRMVINTFAAFRQLGKMKQFQSAQVPIEYWLYFDRIRTSLDNIPEPLGEQVYLQLRGDQANTILQVQRDRLKDEAILSLGIWLPFQEAHSWISQIKQGREELRKLLPFLPEEAIPALPDDLELTELKGECVRRGQMERLILGQRPPSFRSRLSRLLGGIGGLHGPLGQRRIITTLPFVEALSNRRESMASSFECLEKFEKKRPKQEA